MAPHLTTKFAVTRGKYEALPRIGFFSLSFFLLTFTPRSTASGSDLVLTPELLLSSGARQDQIATARWYCVGHSIAACWFRTGSYALEFFLLMYFLTRFDHCWHSELSRPFRK